MTKPLETSISSYAEEVATAIVGEDEVPYCGGEDNEAPHVDGVDDEVPHVDGEVDKVPHGGGEVDEVLLGGGVVDEVHHGGTESDEVTYAEDIGIDVETVDKYTGDEDHTKEAVKCEYCGTGVEGEEELEKHLGKGDGTNFRCGVKQAMEMVRMAESGERKHVCRVCGKGFKTKQYLSVHHSIHSKVKAFKCDVEGCDKSYAEGRNLSKHKKSVHEGVYYECEECGKRFGHKGNMTKHYKMVHEEEKHYKCTKCGKQFGLKWILTQHIKTVHEKIRAFKCEHCKQSFGHASARTVHILGVHSHIRYPCTWQGCTWTTGQKGKVKFHVRRAHTKEWSLECQLCEDQLDIWWGCLFPKEMNKHKAKKHPMEWEEEQEAYRRDHPFVCKYKKCLNRYKTEVEKDRHEVKMH